MDVPVTRGDEEWRSLLAPEPFHLTRRGGAERAIGVALSGSCQSTPSRTIARVRAAWER